MILILKIIAYILLILLAVLIFCIALVIFYPIIYRVDATSIDGEYKATIKARWIFRILGFEAGISNDELWAYYRILFRKHNLLDDEDELDSEDELDLEDELDSEDGLDSEDELYSEDGLDSEDELDLEDELDSENENNFQENAETKEEILDDYTQDVVEEESESAFDKVINTIKGFFENGKRSYKKLRRTCTRIYKKIKKYYKKYSRIKNTPRFQMAIDHIKKEVKIFFKVICPFYYIANIDFCAGQPDWTGKILGVYSLFPFAYKNKGRVVPDFISDEVYIKGDIVMKGRIFPIRILLIALRIFIDKNCRKLYNYITR